MTVNNVTDDFAEIVKTTLGIAVEMKSEGKGDVPCNVDFLIELCHCVLAVPSEAA